jgi:hypothetical protein
LRAFATQGQLSPDQMLDLYGIESGPVRAVLRDYLLERAPSVDHTTLRGLAYTLGRLFWRDLELHHPGISSFHLAPEVATAWKQRIQVTTRTTLDAAGQPTQTQRLRSDGWAQLGQVLVDCGTAVPSHGAAAGPLRVLCRWPVR